MLPRMLPLRAMRIAVCAWLSSGCGAHELESSGVDLLLDAAPCHAHFSSTIVSDCATTDEASDRAAPPAARLPMTTTTR